MARTVERIKVYNHEFQNEQALRNIAKQLENQLNHEISQATDRRPVDLWVKEKEYLQPTNSNLLNSLVDHDLTSKVSNESMITYLGDKYSVPVKYIGQTVSVKITEHKLEIYHASRLIRQHLLSTKKLNHYHDDMKEILETTVFHNLNDKDLANQVETNLRMFDQL